MKDNKTKTIDVTSDMTLIVNNADEKLKTILPGKHATLKKDEALNLIERGMVTPVNIIADNIDSDFIDALIDAIDALDPTTFGSDKKPNVKALKDFTGFEVTANDRDIAWKEYQRLSESDGASSE